MTETPNPLSIGRTSNGLRLSAAAHVKRSPHGHSEELGFCCFVGDDKSTQQESARSKAARRGSLRRCAFRDGTEDHHRTIATLAESMEYTLSITDVGDDEVRKAVLAPLAEYNSSQAGPSQNRPIAVLVKDHAGFVIGGLWGHTGYEWLFTQLLVVPAGLRGRGVGTEIMRLAEREAIQRGCHNAWLDTFEFQAREFYERIGYECFGELPNYPSGFSRFFMKKTLTPAKE